MTASADAPGMTGADPSRRDRVWMSTLFLLCAIVAIGMGVFTTVGAPCKACTGLAPMVLPWLGGAYYAALFLLCRRHFSSPWMIQGASVAVFVHALLISESVVLRHFCYLCMALGCLAGSAALLLACVESRSRPAIGLALLLGVLTGTTCPLDRTEEFLSRRLWPSRILDAAPSFVNRQVLEQCAHDRPVRLLVYESSEACRSCSSLRKRLLPDLEREFSSTLCVHYETISPQKATSELPLLLLYSRNSRLVMVEGLPQYSELWGMVESLAKETQGGK